MLTTLSSFQPSETKMKVFLMLLCLALCDASSLKGLVASSLDLEEIQSKVHPLWLRERCQSSFYVDLETHQPKYNLHEEEEDLQVISLSYVNGTAVQVGFSDKQHCLFPIETLQAELVSSEPTFLQSEQWNFPETRRWNQSSLIAPPLFDHDSIITESDDTRKFLSVLISTGIALVENVPIKEGEEARFGERFSSSRDTEWGVVFNVRRTPDQGERKDLAYTPQRIGMHVDSPYRVTPPAFQLLHALEHCMPGDNCYVHNRFVDGFAVAQSLCENHRQYFDALTSTTLRWENNGGDGSSILFRYAPMIELEDQYVPTEATTCPKVRAINFSAKSGGYAPPMAVDALDVFYQAKRTFSAMLHHDEFTIRVQLYPGALVIFDNQRVLHSRSDIKDEDGPRWLQGCYINRDGILYNYERLRRKWAVKTETPFRTLREATKADYDRMGVEYDMAIVQKTRDNMLDILTSQKDAYLGAPISLLDHGLQTASRALRAGEDDETVVISLFHDMFETLAVKNHGDLVAAMLAPWISPRSQWILAKHEIFQGHYYFHHYGGDINLREKLFAESEPEEYEAAVRWCEEYDQASFDPDYPSLPLSHFVPVVDRVLAKPQYWWNPSHPKAGAVTATPTCET